MIEFNCCDVGETGNSVGEMVNARCGRKTDIAAGLAQSTLVRSLKGHSLFIENSKLVCREVAGFDPGPHMLSINSLLNLV